MYIQITTRCQMTCAHCCYNCTKDGEDMSLATFKAILQDCIDHGDIPFLGGGEPTLHPRFEEFLMLAIIAVAEIGDGPVGIITNGGVTKRALYLANLAKAEIISAQLSRDIYHDEIDPKVVDAFASIPNGIRDTTKGGVREPLPQGRALEILGLDPIEDAEDINMIKDGSNCVCGDSVCTPNGVIRQCGCEDAPVIGEAESGYNSPMPGECCNSSYFIDECVKNEEYAHLLG